MNKNTKPAMQGPWRRTRPGASIFDAVTQKAIAHVYVDGEQRIPVANLIASAPELRDTLQALRDWCDENLNGSPAGYHEIMVRADAVLKKSIEVI